MNMIPIDYGQAVYILSIPIHAQCLCATFCLLTGQGLPYSEDILATGVSEGFTPPVMINQLGQLSFYFNIVIYGQL